MKTSRIHSVVNRPRRTSHLRLRLVFLCAFLSIAWAHFLPAQSPAPPDSTIIQTPQILHTWGSEEMQVLLQTWESAFTSRQPAVRFVDTLKGTETAQAALFSHVAEMAAMSRPILPLERHVMFRREHHLPLELVVATGSPTRLDRGFALGVFVSEQNPVTHLSLDQLDRIFGDQRSGAWDEKFVWHPEAARSAASNIRTWGQAGLTGKWAARPVHVYGYPVSIYSPTSGPMLSFRKEVMQGGDIWNPDLQEYPNSPSILAVLEHDPEGIAYGCACDRRPGTKLIAVARSAGATAVALSRKTVADRSYPLTRSAYLYIDREPGQPIDRALHEFLLYILSPEGQRAVRDVTGYLPLPPALAREQLEKLQ